MNKRLKNIQTFKQHSSELNISDVSEEIKKLKDIGVSFNEEMLRNRIEEFKDMDISELEVKTRNLQHYGSNIHYAAKILISLKQFKKK
jgi:DNA-binding protein